MTQPHDEPIAGATRGRAVADLGFVVAVFLICSAAEPTLDPLLRRGQGLSGVTALAAYQAACEGLALAGVLLFRRERISQYGFCRANLRRSIGLALVLACLNDLGLSWHAQTWVWVPFGRHAAARMSLSAGVPTAVLGIALMLAVWGLLEAFFGVFFAQKVNAIAGHTGRGWLSPGALGFALFNGVIHWAIGQGAAGFVASFASGYAIAVIPAVTGNAWGSAVVQTLTNAVGHL